LPSTALTRLFILPLTWQWAGTGVPATISAPAAIGLAAVMVVFANEIRVARSAHDVNVAPVAGLSCGGESSSSLPPHAERAHSNAAAPAMAQGNRVLMGVSCCKGRCCHQEKVQCNN
jgi:hypothetical protein